MGLELDPQERLRKILSGENPDAPYPEMNAPAPSLGAPYQSVSEYDPPSLALDTSEVDKVAQGFGVQRAQAPNQTSGELLKSQADIHNNKAMEMLREALNSQSEVSPSQALAAGILAIVPTIGGYMAGNAVGSPTLSPHLRLSPDQLQQSMTGGAQGGMIGLGAGSTAAQQYLKSIGTEEDKKDKIRLEMAGLESKMGSQWESGMIQDVVGQSATNRQYAKESQLLKEKDAMEQLPPEAQAQAVQALGLPPGTKLNPSQLRSITNAIEAGRRQSGQEFKFGQSELPGYKNISGAVPTPGKVSELTQQIQGRNYTVNLLNQYVQNPDSLTGQESAMQGALYGMMFNAQRLATASGANFTTTEQGLIGNALPAIKAGNLAEYIKRNLLGRDQQQFARDLINVYQKTQDITLAETYGFVREDVPSNYYPPEIFKKFGYANVPANPANPGTNTDNDPLGIRSSLGGK